MFQGKHVISIIGSSNSAKYKYALGGVLVPRMTMLQLAGTEVLPRSVWVGEVENAAPRFGSSGGQNCLDVASTL